MYMYMCVCVAACSVSLLLQCIIIYTEHVHRHRNENIIYEVENKIIASCSVSRLLQSREEVSRLQLSEASVTTRLAAAQEVRLRPPL